MAKAKPKSAPIPTPEPAPAPQAVIQITPAPAAKAPTRTTVVQVPAPAPAAATPDPWADVGQLDEPEETPTEQPESAPAPPANSSAGQPAPASPSAPTVHTHSKRTVREALDWGFTQSEIDRTADEDLKDAIYERQRAFRLQQQQQAQAATPKPAPEPEPEIKLPFPEDQVGPEVAAWMKAQERERRRLEKEHAAKLAEIEQREQDREVRSVKQRLAAMEKQHAAVLTNEHKKRAILAYLQSLNRTHADDLEADFEAGLKELGFLAEAPAAPAPVAVSPPPPPPAPAPEPEPEPDPLAAQKARFVSGALARPTARTANDLPHGDERARRHLKEKLAVNTLNGDQLAAEKNDWFGE